MSSSDNRRSLALAVLVALVPYALLVARFDFVCDDAYITFRYARNVVAGLGPVFNPGMTPPVEGYSNPLWMALAVLPEAAGLDVTVAARVVSVAAGVLVVALTTGLARSRLALGFGGTVAVALVVATFPPVATWSTGGLETMPFTLTVVGTFAALAAPRRPRVLLAAVCAVLTVLLRTDGALWVGVAIVAARLAAPATAGSPHAEWPRAEEAGGGARTRACVVAIVAAVVVTGLHVLGRYAFYGELVSNTAHVKAGLSGLRIERGLLYVGGFLLAVPSVLLALGAAAATRGGADRRLALGALLVIAFAGAYAVFVGGDFMAMGRFLVPAMPFVALAFAPAAAGWITQGRTALAQGCAAAIVALSVAAAFDLNVVPRGIREQLHFRWNSPVFHSEVEMWRGMRDRAEEWDRLGRALAQYTQPGESMIATAIGAIGYRTELVLLDVFGLVDREVARVDAPPRRMSPGHDRFVSPEFFYPRRPTYYGATLAPAGAPGDYGLPQGFAESALSAIVTVERAELEPGIELRLFRFRW